MDDAPSYGSFQDPNPESSLTTASFLSRKRSSCVINFCIVLLVVLLLFRLGFIGVEYNEYGYKRNIITQTINWETIYENGLYYWFVGFKPFTFPRHLLKIDLINLSIIPDNGLEFYLNATLLYRLNKTRIPFLFKNFGISGYGDQLKKLAIGDIKHIANQFRIEDYFQNRFFVEREIEKRLIKTFYDNNVILDYGMFFLLEMKYPERIVKKYLQTGIQTQENITAYFNQQQVLIEQETNYMASLFLNNASFTNKTARAEVAKIIEIAQTEAYNIRETAKANGLNYFLKNIAVKNNTNISIIVKTMSYLKKHPRIFVGKHFNVYVPTS